MYPSGIGGIGVGAGGVLAVTGFMFAGYIWAGALLLMVGFLFLALAMVREAALRRRRAGRF